MFASKSLPKAPTTSCSNTHKHTPPRLSHTPTRKTSDKAGRSQSRNGYPSNADQQQGFACFFDPSFSWINPTEQPTRCSPNTPLVVIIDMSVVGITTINPCACIYPTLSTFPVLVPQTFSVVQAHRSFPTPVSMAVSRCEHAAPQTGPAMAFPRRTGDLLATVSHPQLIALPGSCDEHLVQWILQRPYPTMASNATNSAVVLMWCQCCCGQKTAHDGRVVWTT